MAQPGAMASMGAGAALVTIIGLWASWYALVLRPAARLTRPWGPDWLAVLASNMLYRFGSWWLNFSHNGEESLKAGTWGKGQQYVMAWHPHGAFTVAALYFVSNWWARGYPGGKRGDRYVCVAPFLLQIPLLAEFLLLCQARSQDSKTFSALLASGATVAVQPGGLIEQVATDATQEQVYFPPNLGFIRLALKRGVPLLPCYAFGENQLYRTASWTRRLNHWFYKNFKTGNLIVLGVFGCPTSPVLPNPACLPIRGTGLHVRFGEPVDIGPAEESPSDARVQEAFNKYIKSLTVLFDAHKDSCLPPEVAARGLKVILRSAPNSTKGSEPCSISNAKL